MKQFCYFEDAIHENYLTVFCLYSLDQKSVGELYKTSSLRLLG